VIEDYAPHLDSEGGERLHWTLVGDPRRAGEQFRTFLESLGTSRAELVAEWDGLLQDRADRDDLIAFECLVLAGEAPALVHTPQPRPAFQHWHFGTLADSSRLYSPAIAGSVDEEVAKVEAVLVGVDLSRPLPVGQGPLLVSVGRGSGRLGHPSALGRPGPVSV